MSAAETDRDPLPALPSELPVVPLRNAVVLPLTAAPLSVSRLMSVEAVNKALSGDRLVLLLLQKNDVDEPSPDDLHRVGTAAIVRQMSKGPNGLRILVEGVARVRAEFISQADSLTRALIKPLPEPQQRTIETDAHVRRMQELVDRALSLATGLSPDVRTLVASLEDPLRIAYLVASLLDMKADDKQLLLEEESLSVKLNAVNMALAREIEILELKGKIESQAQAEMTDAQRQYMLRQQLKAIQAQLGEGDTEIESLRERAAKLNRPAKITETLDREITRLEKMTSASPGYQMLRTYLDCGMELPWWSDTRDRVGPGEA